MKENVRKKYSSVRSRAMILGIYCGIILFPVLLLAQGKVINNTDIFSNMFGAIKSTKTLRTCINTDERITDHINHTHYTVKLIVSPYKLYSKDLDKGVEILYRQDKKPYEATVNPNGFPFVALHLDPMGRVMRTDQHQTIDRMGFNYIGNVLYHFLSKYPDAYLQFVKRDNDTVCDGNSCYKMEVNFPAYTNTTYIVQVAGETVSKLASRYYLSDYQILTLNNISWYDEELKIGQKILLPNAYAKKTVLFIRKDNFLPIVVRIYDDKGFFEDYNYTHLQINSNILDDEFTENYPGYHF
jgi:LysM repeat protein